MRILGPTAIQSIYVLTLQICTLTLLQPSSFGIFSIAYLFGAMCTSFVMSVVCESWQRQGAKAEWRHYSHVLVVLATVTAALGLVVGLAISSLRSIAVASFVAIAANTYRVGARYFGSHEGDTKSVVRGDAAGLLVLVAGVAAIFIWRLDDPLTELVWTWCLSCVAAAVASPWPTIFGAPSLREWVARHKSHIKVLYADSLLLDAANIGIPYLMAPTMGAAGFGVYRGMSSITGPIKLVLFPLRPYFGKIRALRWARFQLMLVTTLISVVMGGLAALGLQVVRVLHVNLGTLTALTDHTLTTSIFFGATLANGVYYLAARSHFGSRGLLLGRIGASVSLIIFPLAGLYWGGLGFALWGAVTANVFSVIVWMALFRYPRSYSVQEAP